ncbi:THAP domain-containing protein 1 [Amyelois transitella]|uniref:THAP domain-containing protein 1 n=1 Tax=Amyelois transitella TaxID=680683 RepID=UPI00067D23F2|nr:THAP domain-containing protein 1 [Amyelois transitella]
MTKGVTTGILSREAYELIKTLPNLIMSYNQIYKTKEHVDHIENKTKPTPIAMVAPEVKQSAEVDTEITKTCAVLGCEASKNMGAESFFRFPEEPNLKQIWTDLTGRNNWTPTDYSYICIQHFSIDCFTCDADNQMILIDKAVPSLKLPRHVLEVEYIDEDTFDNDEDEEMETDYEDDDHKPVTNGHTHDKPNNSDAYTEQKTKDVTENDIELLKLFTEVQRMQRQAVSLKDKLKHNMRIHSRQSRVLRRLEEVIEKKRKVLNAKRKKRSRILLSLQDKIDEDTSGLVLAMPVKQTEDFKNFALSIYKYSPQAYIYIRNTLRTLLPSTDVLDTWLGSGHQPKTAISNSNMIKVMAEQTDTELSCKIKIG